MQKKIAQAISVIFHPSLMPTLGILILFNSDTYFDFLRYDIKKVLFILIFISTFVLPITFIPFYYFQKLIKSINMATRRERVIPFLLTLIMYLFCYSLLVKIGAPLLIKRYILFSAIILALLLLSLIKWKFSVHMAGSGGLAGGILAMSMLLNVNLSLYFILSILVSGLIGYSRLQLQAHKSYEIYAGWFIGAVTIFSGLYFF